MRLASFGPPGAERPGVVCGDAVVDLLAVSPSLPGSIRGILEAGALETVREIAARADSLPSGQRLARAETRLGPPVPNPSKIICLGRNYRDHAEEQGKEAPDYPMMFAKGPNSLAGDGDVVPYPPGVEQYDFEVELAAVVGTRARRVPLERAWEHVAGYTVFMDLTARDLQARERQWFRAKSADGSGPMGPWIVTRDEIDDPHALDIALSLDGETMQSSRTDCMTFRIDFLVHHISQTATLEPGDVIATGTPSGVGAHRTPPRFLVPGDRLVATIERIGTLSCTIG